MASGSASPAKAQEKRRRKYGNRDISAAVVGAQFVGKSALTFRSLAKRYIADSDRVLTDMRYRTELDVDGDLIIFELWDTCCQEPFGVPTAHRIAASDGMIIVYSITDRASFEHVRIIKSALPSDMPVVIVGTKKDLSKYRQVLTDEGKDLAEEFNCSFFEVTATEQSNEIRDALVQLCRDVVEFRCRPRPSTSLLAKVLGGRGKTDKVFKGKSDSAAPKE